MSQEVATCPKALKASRTVPDDSQATRTRRGRTNGAEHGDDANFVRSSLMAYLFLMMLALFWLGWYPSKWPGRGGFRPGFHFNPSAFLNAELMSMSLSSSSSLPMVGNLVFASELPDR